MGIFFAAITTSNPVNTTYAGFSYPSDQYSSFQGGRNNSNTFLANWSGRQAASSFQRSAWTAFQNQKLAITLFE
jgi:hypothetical protein